MNRRWVSLHHSLPSSSQLHHMQTTKQLRWFSRELFVNEKSEEGGTPIILD